jgi:hypothetical protein
MEELRELLSVPGSSSVLLSLTIAAPGGVGAAGDSSVVGVSAEEPEEDETGLRNAVGSDDDEFSCASDEPFW